MTLTASTRLDPYEILSALGAGGMGVAFAIAVLLFVPAAEAQTIAAPRCGAGVHEAEAEGMVLNRDRS